MGEVASIAGLSVVNIVLMAILLILVLCVVEGNIMEIFVFLLGWWLLLCLCLTAATVLVVSALVVDSYFDVVHHKPFI